MVQSHRLRRKLRAGEPVTGAIVNVQAPWFIDLVGISGFDFVMLDAEHGPITPENVELMIRAGAIAAGLLLSAPLAAQDALPRLLDCAVATSAYWLSGHFHVDADGDTSDVISLDTGSGAWFLRNPNAAALTLDGGTFDILDDPTRAGKQHNKADKRPLSAD